MKASIVTTYLSKDKGPREVELWTGEMGSAPRTGEFLSTDPDDASYIVDRVEWNCSGSIAELKVFVK